MRCEVKKCCACGQPTVTIGNKMSQRRLPEGAEFVEGKLSTQDSHRSP